MGVANKISFARYAQSREKVILTFVEIILATLDNYLDWRVLYIRRNTLTMLHKKQSNTKNSVLLVLLSLILIIAEHNALCQNSVVHFKGKQ